MGEKTVYQTLEDRGNPDEIENHGPYMCKSDGAWLGHGFYFWDTFIDNAHWWGGEGGTFNKGYIICSAVCDYDTKNCFDLVGETDHIQYFNESLKLMEEKRLITPKTTVARVIRFIKDEIKVFKYTAIRVYGVHSKRNDSSYKKIILFNPRRPQYLDLNPAIQICFYKKNSLNLRNYTVVFPTDYINVCVA